MIHKMPGDPLYDQLAPLLGHILLEHGNLEGDAGRMLARLDGKMDDHSAAVYASKNTFNEKIGKIGKAAKLKVRDPVIIAEIEGLIVEMARINKLRNKFIHSEYFPELNAQEEVTGFFHRQIKQMGDLIDTDDPNSESPIYHVDLRELEQLIEDMIALELNIRAAAEKYADSLPSYRLPPM
jgi:hypothetical protein